MISVSKGTLFPFVDNGLRRRTGVIWRSPSFRTYLTICRDRYCSKNKTPEIPDLKRQGRRPVTGLEGCNNLARVVECQTSLRTGNM